MDKPEANKTYMLVGGSNVKSIANGDSWAESVVVKELTDSERWELRDKAIKNRVKDILSEIKKVSFMDDYDASDAEAFGTMMSKYFEYDGYEIAAAAGNALEDANFHSWAKVLRDPDSMGTITKGGK